MRDAFYDLSLVRRIAADIKALLGYDAEENAGDDGDHVGLWDARLGEVAAGRMYDDGDDGS